MSTPTAAAADLDADLEAKVRFLRQPASYPEPTAGVSAVETHMSWVFLTDRFAYKLKKPVHFPFLDFSTLARRKHFCEEEIRLNRRLAPSVYLGTVAIRRAAGGALSLAGRGAAVDWLVKMHRLPAERMLDQAIRMGSVTSEDIDRFARRLAAFYRAAPPIAIAAADYRARFAAAVAANLAELQMFDAILPDHRVAQVHARQLDLLREAPELFDGRVADRRIVEAHGDLRPEHVCLGPEPQVIDCLEFNVDFRVLDPVDELSFFAVECEMLGAPAIGAAVLERYRRESADAPPPRLLAFYKCYRACLRAKIALWHLREPRPRTPEHWPALARRYLDLAESTAAPLGPPA